MWVAPSNKLKHRLNCKQKKGNSHVSRLHSSFASLPFAAVIAWKYKVSGPSASECELTWAILQGTPKPLAVLWGPITGLSCSVVSSFQDWIATSFFHSLPCRQSWWDQPDSDSDCGSKSNKAPPPSLAVMGIEPKALFFHELYLHPSEFYSEIKSC